MGCGSSTECPRCNNRWNSRRIPCSPRQVGGRAVAWAQGGQADGRPLFLRWDLLLHHGGQTPSLPDACPRSAPFPVRRARKQIPAMRLVKLAGEVLRKFGLLRLFCVVGLEGSVRGDVRVLRMSSFPLGVVGFRRSQPAIRAFAWVLLLPKRLVSLQVSLQGTDVRRRMRCSSG